MHEYKYIYAKRHTAANKQICQGPRDTPESEADLSEELECMEVFLFHECVW